MINACVVTPDMSVMFCACQADKGDLLKQKLAPATIQWVFYGFVVDKNRGFYLLEDCWSSSGRFSPEPAGAPAMTSSAAQPKSDYS